LRKKLKNKDMVLIHKTTGTEFEFIDNHKPQFSNITFARLMNLKTKRIEQFNKATYMQYFEQKTTS
jgi:hypothetical protein